MRNAIFLASALLLACGCGADKGSTGGDGAVPAEKAALFDFLTSGGYADFAAESAPHTSAGPHGGAVRVFLDPVLEQSLAAGNTTHPRGAAAVKELGLTDGEPSGWAVFVKLEDDSNGGDNIYWYEILSTTDGSDPPYEGAGEAICKNCHAGGADFYLSAYPLQ